MVRSRTCTAVTCAATLILGLMATPAFAQHTHEPPLPNAATGPASPASQPGAPQPGAPQPGGTAGMTQGINAAPRTVINNTFNPTGPTGTGTFSPTAEFIVCVTEDGAPSGGMRGMMSARASHVEGRIAFLKAELKLTDAQLPLWNAVAGAMREHARSMAATSGETLPATLPGRVAALEKAETARLNAVHKLKAAVDPLYAALSDEQKKIADELTADMDDDSMMTHGHGMKGGAAH